VNYCEQLVAFCLDYLEGDLPGDEQVRFRRHLGQCPDCVTFFETYRRTAEISRRAVQTAMPEALKQSIQSFLRERCNRKT
jgi:predicted anti-sigma-YlaC factor YlaD